MGLVLPYQNCSRVDQRRGDTATNPVFAPANDGFPIEGKTFAYQDPSCPVTDPVKTRVKALSPSSAFVLRENCADVAPPRPIASDQFTLPPDNPASLIYGGETLVLEVPPASAPQFVNAQSVWAGGQSAVTVSAPTGIADGDLLLAYITDYMSVPVTPPPGWQALTSHNSTVTGYGFFVFYKFASPADIGASFTFTLAASTFDNFGMIAAYRGTASSNPIELGGGWRDANVATPTTTATYAGGTASSANSLVVALASTDTGTGQPGVPAGFVSQHYVGAYGTRLSGRVQAVAGPIGDFTSSARSRWITNVLILKGR